MSFHLTYKNPRSQLWSQFIILLVGAQFPVCHQWMWGLIGYSANIDKNAQTVLINDYAIVIFSRSGHACKIPRV